jgi:hypothetical protein
MKNHRASAKKESCMVKENLNSRLRFVKWEQEDHERKIENKIATTLHPASAAITDQWVCGYYIRYTEGAIILVKITY